MKVLLFTHSQDIDGMGCAILARKAFGEYTLVPTKTFDITANVKRYIDDKSIYEYDKVFVTDLCIKEPLLGIIDNNDMLKEKIIVLDHHKTEIEEGNNKYSFVNIIVEENGIKVSGTKLFYEYLINNGYLTKTSVLDELVEWTRQYDVWDWKKNNNYEARKLHILFEILGYEKYLELINYKVDNLDSIIYNDYEKSVISKFEKDLEDSINKCLKDIKTISLKIEDNEYNVGYIKCPYKYRNDVNEIIIRNGNIDIDVIGMIMTDIDTVSYRQIKDIDISVIAKYFGGKGHRNAASNPQNNDKFKSILDLFEEE